METITNDTIPMTYLNFNALPQEERFSAWQESVSLLFSASSDLQPNDTKSTGYLTTYHLGSLLFSNAVSHKQQFHRSNQLISHTGLDHFLVQIYRKGGTRGLCGKTALHARPGDVFLLDLSQPLATCADDFDNFTLVIPRQLLSQYLRQPEKFHGRLLPRESVLGRLLNEHLSALWKASSKTSAEEAGALAQGVAGMISAYFAQVSPSEESPEVAAATCLSIRQYISQHFNNPRLTPEFLADRFRISRAHLYRLFKPYGGVSEYIKERRLIWCLAELGKPANKARRIIDIALAAGFTSETHFSRLFRQTFGITPKEARQGATPAISPTVGGYDFIDWRHLEWLKTLG